MNQVRSHTRSGLPPRQAIKPSNPDYDRISFEYLKAKCIVQPNGCWEIQGVRHRSKGMRDPNHPGYGDFSYRGKNMRAHRAAYIMAKGPIPTGYVIAHSCDNPPCCNPDHLSAKTELENAAEMIEKRRNYEQRRTQCPQGHPYDEHNTLWVRAKSGRMARQCKACNRRHSRERWHRDASVRERQRARRAERRAQLRGMQT